MEFSKHQNNDIQVVDALTMTFKEDFMNEPSLNEFHVADLLWIFAQNSWKEMAEGECYNNASPEHKAQLANCWRRRTDLLLKEVANLDPNAAGLTRSEIEEDLCPEIA